MPRIVSIGIISLVLTACDGGTGPGPVIAQCGPYPVQTSSPYVLPYQIGLEFTVGQGNCTIRSHNPNSMVLYAYDFLMPIGTPIVAARSGTVLLTEARFVDGNRQPGEENFINITHDDGTIAAYVHLTQNGVFVNVGDVVRLGDIIGISGDTGSSSEPHLHSMFKDAMDARQFPSHFQIRDLT